MAIEITLWDWIGINILIAGNLILNLLSFWYINKLMKNGKRQTTNHQG